VQQIETLNTWLFVAHNTLHLEYLNSGEESWWCVDRQCKPGEIAFVYRPLYGIARRLEILELSKKTEMFCNAYGMATARIKVLNLFSPPITPKMLKTVRELKDEAFVRRNFQGKSFLLRSRAAGEAILKIATPARST